MSLISLIAAACKAFRDSLREQASVDLLAVDDHTLADLGLRRADLRVGLWRPNGMVDGDPAVSPRSLDPKDFAADWPLF
jgi:uncharacterized protein YjiS (DUF1127 family)